MPFPALILWTRFLMMGRVYDNTIGVSQPESDAHARTPRSGSTVAELTSVVSGSQTCTTRKPHTGQLW